MARQQPLKHKLQERLSVLKALRDEIRLDLHLASMELRDEWRELESKLPDPIHAAAELKGATSKTLDRLAGELKHFQARIRRNGVSDRGVGRFMTRDPLGVITDRDAAIAATTRGKRMDELPVEAVMNRNVAACTEREDLDRALSLMRARRVRRLPVTDDHGRLVGVVTLADVARAAARKPAEVLATLLAITEPRAAATSGGAN